MKRFDTILLDFDGTIVSPKRRLYSLFKELTDCSLSYDEYWQEKARGKNQEAMLALIGSYQDREFFRQQWLKNVERPDLLDMDVILPGVKDALVRLKATGMKLILVTNRQSYQGTVQELTRLGIADCFAQVIVTEQRLTKAEAVARNEIDFVNALFVGDSVEDMKAAKSLHIPGVLLMDKSSVPVDGPADFCISSLKELEVILGEE